MRMSVAAIIVAAGASRRLGQPKQLVLIDGEPLLQRVIRFAAGAGANPVLVVLGAHRQIIEEAIDFGIATVLVNCEWEEGMSSSIRTGVKAVSTGTEAPGVMLMTCDQPRVTPEHLRKMIEAFEAQEGTALVASIYAGVRGTPAIFPRTMFAELLELRGDKGARAMLANAPVPIVEIQLEGGEIDIDRPKDLAGLG
jgi:molybdenum cofactor cytidylyltransferase